MNVVRLYQPEPGAVIERDTSALPVKYADECIPCPDCGEPYCEECNAHYADCAHPGPHSEPDPAA